MAEADWRRSASQTAPWLLGLLLLFVLRVAAQLLVALGWGSWLPPFEAFMSGLLPYPYLLPAQILIVAVYGKAWADFRDGAGWAVPHSGWGVGLLVFGWLYLVAMVYRFYLWAAYHYGTLWMGGPIPPLFHWVLASFILLLGGHHLREGRRASSDRPHGD